MKTTIKVKTGKYLLLALLLSGMSIVANSQSYEPKGKGKVKSMLIVEEKQDMMIKKSLKDYEVWYDKDANKTEEINYKQGRVTKHFKYYYDTDENKIREEEFDADGDLIEYTEYKIVNGLRVEKNVYDKNKKLLSKTTYTYTTF